MFFIKNRQNVLRDGAVHRCGVIIGSRESQP